MNYIIQNVITTREVSRFPLYFKLVGGRTPLHVVLQDDNTLRIKNGDSISFDTYFNAFFEHYIASHTTVKSVVLELELAGIGVIEVFRYVKGKAPETLLIQSFDSPQGPCIKKLVISLENSHVTGSRIAFTITGKKGGGRFVSGNWSSSDKPVRDVVINTAICTFKKASYVRRAVSRLIGYAPLSLLDWRLVIIDNGAELTTEEFNSQRVQVICQSNVGGAGGFTRGAIESLRQKASSDRKPTHVLFMDDDMDMEPECLFRTIHLLGYMTKESCVGGAMLDFYNPVILFEQGAILDNPRDFFALRAKHSGLPLQEAWALENISVSQSPLTYNAWWFFAFPLSAVEKIGLPMPCFIRGDDQEYGMRLAQSGFQTMTPPGIGIWHEPFYAKPATWMQYFGLYNNLIMACIRRDEVKVESVPLRVKKIIFNAMERKDYETAMVHLGALQDFLEGPRLFMETTPADRLKRARGFSSEFGPEVLPLGANYEYKHPGHIRSFFLRELWRRLNHGHFALGLLKKLGFVAPVASIPEHEWDWHVAVRSETVVVSHPWLSYLRAYRTKPALYEKIRNETNTACRQLESDLPTLKKRFKEAELEFTSLAFWCKYLKIN